MADRTMAEAAASGDELAGLETMRDMLAEAMDVAPPTVIAQIAGRLQAVLARIGELDVTRDGGFADALAERRAARGQGTKPVSGSRRGTKSAS